MVVTLVHFYCGLRRVRLLIVQLIWVVCSNPCPFLLWIATLLPCDMILWLISSNPCPFLLWIATLKKRERLITAKAYGSNPCPFLLWIATKIRAMLVVFGVK